MFPFKTFKSSKSLEGVHGVHIVPHSPFALEDINKHGNVQSAAEASAVGNQRLWMKGSSFARDSCKCCNSSLPFIALGMQAPRSNLKSRLYANSLVGVGVASVLYHSSKGTLKRFLRWADYTMIATTTICVESSQKRKPKNLDGRICISSTNPAGGSYCPPHWNDGGGVCKKSIKRSNLRMTQNVHKMLSLLGGALFIADDLFPNTHFIHAVWHLAAAVGVGTCNKLLE